jgi:hypothetical protein
MEDRVLLFEAEQWTFLLEPEQSRTTHSQSLLSLIRVALIRQGKSHHSGFRSSESSQPSTVPRIH